MSGGADNLNGDLGSYITGADSGDRAANSALHIIAIGRLLIRNTDVKRGLPAR